MSSKEIEDTKNQEHEKIEDILEIQRNFHQQWPKNRWKHPILDLFFKLIIVHRAGEFCKRRDTFFAERRISKNSTCETIKRDS